MRKMKKNEVKIVTKEEIGASTTINVWIRMNYFYYFF